MLTHESPAAAPDDRASLEAKFLAHLPAIERTIGLLAHRHGFRDNEATDVASWVKLRLIQEDYSALRKFRGESKFTTYLTAVIASLVQDYRVQRWGRWRPSAEAVRRGGIAMKLEALVYRQGYTLAEAAQVMRSAGDTKMSDRELAALLACLPARSPLRPHEISDDAIAEYPAPWGADDLLRQQGNAEERRSVEASLRRALETLPPEDRCIVVMRYWQDMTVADIARATALPQKRLYKRIERCLSELRRRLSSDGVLARHASELIGERER